MQIQIHIDDRLITALRRIFRGKRGAILAGACVLASAGAIFAVTDPTGDFAPKSVISADAMNKRFNALYKAVGDLETANKALTVKAQNLADEVTSLQAADCPLGYTHDTTAVGITLCKQGVDEVVKVGTGGAAFWVDRYEASVWGDFAATTTQWGATDGKTLALDFPATFPRNGQGGAAFPAFVPLYAVSKKSVKPSGGMSWFQAQAACRASGKRLPTGEEWLAAASGTPDPGPGSTAMTDNCVTQDSGTIVTGSQSNCVSASGANDMIGNVAEWTAEWYAGTSGDLNNFKDVWPAGFGGDGTLGVLSMNKRTATEDPAAPGVPSAANRGGWFNEGALDGVFSMSLADAPSSWSNNLGFRCVIPRP